MSIHITAHYREPMSTMQRRPIPPHVATIGPCGHCGSADPSRWRWHCAGEASSWMCECFWFPERRPRYQRECAAMQTEFPGHDEPWWTK